MPRDFYIADWPYPPEETPLLTWVRSPRQRTDDKQWRTAVSFEHADGHWSEFELPWGMLPILRAGQRYANGYALPGEFVGERQQISLACPPRLEPAAAVLPAGFFPAGPQDHGQELCLVFDPPTAGSGPRVVLPAIEAIRALLVPNKTLAYGLFEPGFLDGILTANDLQGECLHLDFNAQIPLLALPLPVVGRLARLLHDPSFRWSWDRVAAERMQQAGPGQNEVPWPLACHLPELKATWNVRCRQEGEVLLILEVLGAVPARDLPFTEVYFDHPAMRARVKGSGKEKGRTKSPGKAAKADEKAAVTPARVSPGPRPPRAPSEPKMLKAPPLPVLDLDIAAIIRAPKKESRRGDTATGEGEGTKAKPVAEDMVNVSDVGRGGRLPAAEFKPAAPKDDEGVPLNPLPLIAEPSHGLRLLGAALLSLEAQKPDHLEIRWNLDRLCPDTVPKGELPVAGFARVGRLARRYALVRLRWPTGVCWTLEFGCPDERVLSTLLFQPLGEPEGGVRETLKEILGAALDPGGYWREAKLQELQDEGKLRYLLLRHINTQADIWARRLYRRAAFLAGGSPSFLPLPGG